MSETAAITRQLKIKVSVIYRYRKEKRFYSEEVGTLQRKLDELVSDGAEEWDVKNTRRMAQESGKMILDIESRLTKAIGELSDLLKQVEEKPGITTTEEFTNAQQTLKEAEN